ncbi:MAG: diaminopropionate ammonia-lyase [Gammaproteobacteria bacterium]|nr:diaminopropionate ammonia-lyase [Gammaproteobacteria bacterium]
MTQALKPLANAAHIVDAWFNDELTKPDAGAVSAAATACVEQLFPKPFLQAAQQEIQAWPNYAMTELVPLPLVASQANVDKVLFKDEGTRFGLGSFKALGGAYAVISWLAGELSDRLNTTVTMEEVRTGRYASEAASITVVSATDGNHGRSVAWGAQQAGCACQIYIHREVSDQRAQAVSDFGARVVRVDGDYDESVRRCAADAKVNEWQVISDTSYVGYTDVPRLVMAGYTTMVAEILDTVDTPPTHVLVQAGVGGLAAAICAAFVSELGAQAPRFIVVESEYADCVIRSLRQGSPQTVNVIHETIMAGLSCGEISLLAYEVLKECVSAVVTIPDTEVPNAMRLLAAGHGGSRSIEAGECAVPGLIALLAMNEPGFRQRLSLDSTSRVLLFGCEGATDPVIYQRIISGQL